MNSLTIIVKPLYYYSFKIAVHFICFREPVQSSNADINWLPLNIRGLDDMKNENLCLLYIDGSYEKKHFTQNYTCGYHNQRMKFWANQSLYENFGGLS